MLDNMEAAMSPNQNLKSQSGFSMIELLVSLAVTTIVTGAAFALVGSSIKFASGTYNTTDAEQSLRAAQEVINRDLTTAGSGLKGMGNISVPKTFVQNYLTQTPIVDPLNPNYVNLALVVSDDNVPANTAVPQASPAVNVMAGTDRLTMLTQDTSFNGGQAVTLLSGKITFSGSNTNILVPNAALFRTGEMYAIASGNSVAFGVVSSIAGSTLTLTNGDTYGINQTGSGTPIDVVSVGGTQPTSLMRLQIIHYYLNANNLLIRRVFGVPTVTFVDSVVAEHVTGLQFRYLLNMADANGFVPQPVRQLSNANQQRVREVETTVSVETAKAVNAVTANNNGRQSISTTAATSVRNMQFRKAL
jgi:prepilin-type N-terminal cleavage/methylation domain-containing protein